MLTHLLHRLHKMLCATAKSQTSDYLQCAADAVQERRTWHIVRRTSSTRL